jgi:hypothetical protein
MRGGGTGMQTIPGAGQPKPDALFFTPLVLSEFAPGNATSDDSIVNTCT